MRVVEFSDDVYGMESLIDIPSDVAATILSDLRDRTAKHWPDLRDEWVTALRQMGMADAEAIEYINELLDTTL